MQAYCTLFTQPGCVVRWQNSSTMAPLLLHPEKNELIHVYVSILFLPTDDKGIMALWAELCCLFTWLFPYLYTFILLLFPSKDGSESCDKYYICIV